eukprot:scaffold271937_cov21-Tisochrysis_lutea.AAC.1
MSIGRPMGKAFFKPSSVCHDAEGSAAEGPGSPGGLLAHGREKGEDRLGAGELCKTERMAADRGFGGEGTSASTGSQELLDEILAGIGAEPAAAA